MKKDKQITREYILKYKYLRAVIFGIVLGCLILGINIPRDVQNYNQKHVATIDQGWTQTVDGVEIAIGEVSDFVPIDTSEWMVLEHIIEPEMVGKNVAFYTEHQEVLMTVDEKELYGLECPELLTTLGSPGRTWVSVHISDDLLGKVLQIKMRSEFPLFQGGPTSVYSLSESELYFVQRDSHWMSNMLALIVFFLAIISYINAHIWEQRKMRKYLLAMADVYLFVAVWVFSEVNIWAIWSGRTVLSMIISMVCSRILPIVFYYFFRISLSYTSWRIKTMGVLVMGNFVGTLAAQFILGISILQLLSVQLVTVAVVSGLMLMELAWYYKNMRKYKEYNKVLYSIAIIPAAALAEVYIYSDYFLRKQWLGVPLGAACVIYSIVVHVCLVRAESKTKTKKNHLETEYNNLNKKPLNQQINAHFLYNSLNTISAYCKVNPQLADKMVCLVAKYMRAYMKFINACEYVTLTEELALTQNYMDIQNVRFENSMVFSIDNNCENVMVPPLSLQPLVENAVNHGFGNRWYCGEIRIQASCKCNYAEITVSDNGEGFDTQELKNAQGVGLKNLEARINAMGGGIQVESELEKGTVVTVWVPI